MSFSELARLAWRHWIVVIVVLLLTAAVGLDFRHSKPLYQSTGTITFSASLPGQQPTTSTVSTDDLIITANVLVNSVMSPSGALQVRKAGGMGDYQLALVNSYNEQYPSYQDPAATLQASSGDPAVAESTFAAALVVIQRNLLARQAAVGTSADALISASLNGGASGPVPQSGYPKRTYAGLGLLAVIAAYCMATALDRHPRWRTVARVRCWIRVGRRSSAQHPR
jgi:hypothetical protein